LGIPKWSLHPNQLKRTVYATTELPEDEMTDWTNSQRRTLRGGLVVLAISPAIVGVWGLAAPRSFFDDFPGGGRHWVSALGPYNEHLLRDYASANLAFLVLVGFAAIVMERRLVQGALLAYAVGATPHLIYHLTTTGHYGTGDNIASLASLALLVVLPLYLLWLTLPRVARRPQARPAIAVRGDGT
jgi:hypothetical protein